MKNAENFKKEALAILNYCLKETKNVAKQDGLEDEELKENEAYCEGLQDAIEKIEKIKTE